MTSAVAAAAAPVATAPAAPARAEEVGWTQRMANLMFGAPSARRACGGRRDELHAESAAQREVAP